MTATTPPPNQSLDARLKHLSNMLVDMVAMLRTQQEMLATRHIELPVEPIDQLGRVAEGIRRLTTALDSDIIELQQLRELTRTSALLISSLDLDSVLNQVLDTVISLTKAERGYIVLKDPITNQLEFRVARSIQRGNLSEQDHIVSRTIVARVAKAGEPIVTTNAENDARFKDSKSIASFMLRSILCVPLKRKGEVIGVIYVDNRVRANMFSPRETRLVYAFANQASIAIENARLFESIRTSLKQILEMKEFMDKVFASIGSGVIATAVDDLITTINAAAGRILDIPHDTSVGESLWKVLPSFYKGFDDLYRTVRLQNHAQMVEVEPILTMRGQVNLNLKLSPLKDSELNTYGVTMVVDDLTELRQREATISSVRRYLPLVDNIHAIDGLELGGVEREISVLFCDVRNFTSFSEKLDPETLMTVINQYLTVSSEAITLSGGIIDKYMGDAVVGLYNTQLNPQANHAISAVRSAMTMLHDVRALHEILPPEQRLFYGIGIHTGSAILGNVGSPRRKEFTVIGDTLQIAKTLQQYAMDAVIITQQTYDQVKEVFTAELLELHQMKEELPALTLYQVIGLVKPPT